VCDVGYFFNDNSFLCVPIVAIFYDYSPNRNPSVRSGCGLQNGGIFSSALDAAKTHCCPALHT